jgi:hypothetical protein
MEQSNHLYEVLRNDENLQDCIMQYTDDSGLKQDLTTEMIDLIRSTNLGIYYTPLQAV